MNPRRRSSASAAGTRRPPKRCGSCPAARSAAVELARVRALGVVEQRDPQRAHRISVRWRTRARGHADHLGHLAHGLAGHLGGRDARGSRRGPRRRSEWRT